MSRPKILLADDHTIVIEGLSRLLEAEFELVGAVGDGRALLSAAENLRPDVIVTDISMPLLNGLEAIRQLKKAGSRAKVIFLTMHADGSFAAEALRAGASGYLLKHSAAEELVRAIREVLKGRSYVSPLIASDTIGNLMEGPDSLAKELTSREGAVVRLVAEGRTAKKIAVALNISSRTVEFHKYNAMEKLNLHTTAQLIKHALKHRFTPS